MDNNAAFIALLLVALVAGLIVFIIVLLASKRKHVFDKMEYQTDFLAIENQLDRGNKYTFNTAVVEADKLLDKALRELQIPGSTMGERMKRCGKERFSHLNDVWYAHKLRNQIAHEPGFTLSFSEARRALTIYRQALKDLGAI